VLPGRGSLDKPFAHNAMNNALKVALPGQDIPAFTIHDLRRTASTLLHEHGRQADVVEKALNQGCKTGRSTRGRGGRCWGSGGSMWRD
jgi:integrase